MKKKQVEKVSVKGYIVALVACVLFSLVGVMLIKAGVVSIAYARSCTAETTGTVIDVAKKKRSATHSKQFRSKYVYVANYSYEVNGKEFTDTFVSGEKIKNGKTIKIRYSPDDPEHKYVKGHEGGVISSCFILIFGIFWVALFLLIFVAVVGTIRRKISENKRLGK